MRVLLISLGTLFVMGILILMVRIWGMSQTFTDYPHEFFNSGPVTTIVKADTLDKVRAILAKKPDAVIWVDVRISKDKIAFSLPPSRDSEFLDMKKKLQDENPQTPILTGGKLSEYPWEQINEFYKTTPALKEYYEQFPQVRFVLNVVDNVLDVHTSVISAIDSLNPDKRTLIQSEANVIMTAIKDLKPMWVYGTGTPDLVRLLSFDSLYVLPATQFKGDVFIAPIEISRRPAFNADVIAEMRRRHKRVFLGPLKSADDIQKAQEFSPDGYIYESIEQF